ncbi:MarC family protein [Aureimonas frigidaquae]|nr:MarC family protein [Aureimonas frigidaquae]
MLLTGFITLIVIIDPFGLVPLFLTLTPGRSRDERRRIAFQASTIAFLILAVFALFGLALIEAIGVSLGAFRVAGGLFLFTIAFELVFEKRQHRKEKSAGEAVPHPEDTPDVAAFPLAIPLLAGPGAISAVILLSGNLPGLLGQSLLLMVIALVCAATFLFLSVADRLDRLMGATGRAVVTRLLGVLLAALAVQFVADGARQLFEF